MNSTAGKQAERKSVLYYLVPKFLHNASLRKRLIYMVILVASLGIIASTVVSYISLREATYRELDTRLREAAQHIPTSNEELAKFELPNYQDGAPEDTNQTSAEAAQAAAREKWLRYFNRPGWDAGTVYLWDTPQGRSTVRITTEHTIAELTENEQNILLEEARHYPRTITVGTLGTYRILEINIGKLDPNKPNAPTTPTVIVGMLLERTNHNLTEMGLILAGTGLISLLFISFTGSWLIRQELQPLAQLAHLAKEVANTPLESGAVELNQRANATNPKHEIGAVGVALNHLLDNIDTALNARHQSEQTLRQFVADASHELRTPLASILGYTELLQMKASTDPAKRERALQRIGAEAERMRALVEDLLLLARMDEGQGVQKTSVNIAQLLADALFDAQVASGEHHWELEIAQDSDLENYVTQGEESRLRQVFANLLANVRLHTPNGTHCKVAVKILEDTNTPANNDTTDTVTDFIEVTISDDGPGIPPELKEKVFDRFTRGEASRNRKSGTSGLGLSIVKALIEAHNGEITLLSPASGTGTIMQIRLPRLP